MELNKIPQVIKKEAAKNGIREEDIKAATFIDYAPDGSCCDCYVILANFKLFFIYGL